MNDRNNVAGCILSLDPAMETKAQKLLCSQTEKFVYAFLKRSIDLLFAITVLLGFWWLLLAIWLLIRIDSPGPGLFIQERVGRHSKPFACVKFRTMRLGTSQAGTHEISFHAVTGFGAMLRRLKLDELPQVVNILRNEMSLVGPRPCLPIQTDVIACRRQRGVFDIKPGITGFAQVNRVDMSSPELLAEFDACYLAQRSVSTDAKILLFTCLGRGIGDGLRGAA